MSPVSKRRRLVAGKDSKDPRDELRISMMSIGFKEDSEEQSKNDESLKAKKGKKKGAKAKKTEH